VKELFELSALHVLVALKREGGSAKQRIKTDLDRYFPPRFTTLVKSNVAKDQILSTYADLKLVSSEKAQQGALKSNAGLLQFVLINTKFYLQNMYLLYKGGDITAHSSSLNANALTRGSRRKM